MTDSLVKTRFAPSPTGQLHLGNVRTALFNWLLAQRTDGVFLLRIEDTDAERSRAQFTTGLQTDLHWLGLDWQEGPGVGGAQAPYAQSERAAIYEDKAAALEAQGKVYPCFCSVLELEMARKAQRAAGRPPRYPGTCAHLTAEQVAAKRAQGLVPTWRFRIPAGCHIEFDDLVRGPQRFASDDIGDFVIRRGDGSAAFFFSNAVDDGLMGVTHVLRGEDHLANTPRQILLLEALGLPVPHYGHIAMIVGADGAPLSKRSGSLSVAELQANGYMPLGVLNYLARLGHHFADESFMTRRQLAQGFDIAHLGRSPARYDAAQLLHWQQQAIAYTDDAALWDWMGEATHALVPDDVRDGFITLVRGNVRFPVEAQQWARIVFSDALTIEDAAREQLAQAAPQYFHHALEVLQAVGAEYDAFITALKMRAGVKGKALFMPLRAALTGTLHGPELAGVMRLMPLELMRKRLTEQCRGGSQTRPA
jgi:nondiscriminating glutamyl-tRNA synthetase